MKSTSAFLLLVVMNACGLGLAMEKEMSPQTAATVAMAANRLKAATLTGPSPMVMPGSGSGGGIHIDKLKVKVDLDDAPSPPTDLVAAAADVPAGALSGVSENLAEVDLSGAAQNVSWCDNCANTLQSGFNEAARIGKNLFEIAKPCPKASWDACGSCVSTCCTPCTYSYSKCADGCALAWEYKVDVGWIGGGLVCLIPPLTPLGCSIFASYGKYRSGD